MTFLLFREFVDSDYSSTPDEIIYSLGLYWAGKLWVILLRDKNGQLIIKDVTTATI